MNNDLISRQAAIDGADKIIERDTSGNNDVVKAMEAWKEWIKGLPSAQPEYKLDEWCTDCKEYDKKRGSCPRFNRVIRTALQDSKLQSRWIPCSEKLPEVGQEVLLTYSANGQKNLFVYTGYWDGEEWLSIWDEYRASTVAIIYHAWMPLPEPYRGG